MSEEAPDDSSIGPNSEKPDKDNSIRKKLQELNWLMYGLVVVLFLGFAGMFVAVSQVMVDSLFDRRDSTYDLQKKIDEQNAKIDTLTNEIKAKKQ